MAQTAAALAINRTPSNVLADFCNSLRAQLENPGIKQRVSEAVQDHMRRLKAGERNPPGSSSHEGVFNSKFVGDAIRSHMRDKLGWTEDQIRKDVFVEGRIGPAPAGKARQLFTKSDVTRKTFPSVWNDSSGKLTPSNACPDFAILHIELPFRTVGEVKYFKAGTPALALYNVAREATFYLGAFAANKDRFAYDSAVIVVGDASPDHRFCRWVREKQINQELYRRFGEETGIYLADVALQ
jgi:hypothetical protein